jgi:hypothetical protein
METEGNRLIRGRPAATPTMEWKEHENTQIEGIRKSTNASAKITNLGPRFKPGIPKTNTEQELCSLDRGVSDS